MDEERERRGKREDSSIIETDATGIEINPGRETMIGEEKAQVPETS